MKNKIEAPWEWFFDEFVKQWITLYYWPYFVAGNLDDWIGTVTLNGFKSSNLCKPK